jgi:uncharacterized protein with PIN domain
MISIINTEPRFVCDDNLGKLARYLRVGGFDTIFDKNITDGTIIQISLDEQRHILTRDHRLIERTLVRDYFLIENNLWPDQLRAVMSHFGLRFKKERMFVRCLEDNTVIVPVEKKEIKELVYPFTYKTHDEFRQCPTCKRVYWSGTHITAVTDRLKRNGFVIADQGTGPATGGL